MPRKKTADAVEILRRRFGDDAATRRRIEQEKLNAEIARLIREARTAAGLTQAQLAERVGTRQQVIARLEDADYEGHSLSMVRRIAEALGLDVEVRFVPAAGQRRRRG